MCSRVFVLILLYLVSCLPLLAYSKNVTTIHVDAGFSVPLQLPEAASTIAIGNQGIIATNTLKPDLIMINGQATGATSMTVFGRSGKIYEYRIQVVNDIFQLRSMINAIEKHVVVEDLNGIIVLKGTVPTPTALVRVLTIADRYVTGSAAPPDFSVISDRGGVLSGNLEEVQGGVEEEISGVSPDPRISIPTVQIGRGAGGGGGAGGGQNALARAFRQPLMPIKGNLAQNISRGEVVMVGGGKVMSMIQVAKQPKVEIQMQIIAVDRNKTDEFGIDWRLDRMSGGKRVVVGSTLGDVSSSGGNSPDQIRDTFSAGDASIFGVLDTGKYFLSTFLKFLQQKGAAKTLSNPLVTAISGESASFLVGGNVPIPVQTAVAGSLGGGAAVATNVRFIQFGLKLIVRPTVLESGKISIVLDQSISEPDYSQAINIIGTQVPGFTQRSISTITESASGESWAVAGLLSEENAKNLDQIPWLSKIPVIGFLFQKKTDSKTRNELMILVNARVIDGDNQTSTSFDDKGDLAPVDNLQEEQGDIPVKEESLSEPAEKPALPTKPKTNNNGKKSLSPVTTRRQGLISGSLPDESQPLITVNELSKTVELLAESPPVQHNNDMLAEGAVVEWRSPGGDNKSQVLLINTPPPALEELPQVIMATRVTPAYPIKPQQETQAAAIKQAPADKTDLELLQELIKQNDKKAGAFTQPARSIFSNGGGLLNSPIVRMSEPNQFLIKPKPVLGRIYKPITNPSMVINPLSVLL
ncbi:type II and III secretion system protein family protein [Methylophilus aquaticus]|uniref:Pilus assembly protein N-terminal domain-containing protein n=1 Tax=Methylophilus aquaticus TaxID=1971610 RepID=A0ABT9JP99_9PROT|nr:pilus assembly protein N-terminal domain-containing protein [Methylophilus aquaticus]MDP8566384.1 pilus assembly protein N-terminal domain-containing protein [Methylophilus aquaticus]